MTRTGQAPRGRACQPGPFPGRQHPPGAETAGDMPQALPPPSHLVYPWPPANKMNLRISAVNDLHPALAYIHLATVTPCFLIGAWLPLAQSKGQAAQAVGAHLRHNDSVYRPSEPADAGRRRPQHPGALRFHPSVQRTGADMQFAASAQATPAPTATKCWRPRLTAASSPALPLSRRRRCRANGRSAEPNPSFN